VTAHVRFASNVNLLCDPDRIIDLDAEVANGVLDLHSYLSSLRPQP
jgi:hypothetical protein